MSNIKLFTFVVFLTFEGTYRVEFIFLARE